MVIYASVVIWCWYHVARPVSVCFTERVRFFCALLRLRPLRRTSKRACFSFLLLLSSRTLLCTPILFSLLSAFPPLIWIPGSTAGTYAFGRGCCRRGGAGAGSIIFGGRGIGGICGTGQQVVASSPAPLPSAHVLAAALGCLRRYVGLGWTELGCAR